MNTNEYVSLTLTYTYDIGLLQSIQHCGLDDGRTLGQAVLRFPDEYQQRRLALIFDVFAANYFRPKDKPFWRGLKGKKGQQFINTSRSVILNAFVKAKNQYVKSEEAGVALDAVTSERGMELDRLCLGLNEEERNEGSHCNA